MAFSRQEYWSRLPFPPPGDLLDPGIEPASLASPTLAGGFLTTEPPGKPVLPGRWFFPMSLSALLYVLAGSLVRTWWHCWAFLYKREVSMVYFKRIMKNDERKWRPMGSQYLLSWVLGFCRLLAVCVEKAMAPHSSTLAWKIPWTEEPARLQSMGTWRGRTWLSDQTTKPKRVHCIWKSKGILNCFMKIFIFLLS